MAYTDATVFAVKGQAYRVYGWVTDSTTGNGIAVGTLSASISKDGGTAGSTIAPPAGVAGMTGRFSLDLEASEMNANNIGVEVSSSTTNAISARIDILPMDFSEPTGHWLTQTVKKFEHGVIQLCSYFFNFNKRNKSTGTITLYKLDGTTAVGTMARVDTSTDLGKGEMDNA